MPKLKLQYLATWCKELTHWKRAWCWERLNVGGEGNDRGWDTWMASPTLWMSVWVNSWSWWWTGRPGVLRFTGSQRVGHDWATELNWSSRLPLLHSQVCFIPKSASTLLSLCRNHKLSSWKTKSTSFFLLKRRKRQEFIEEGHFHNCLQGTLLDCLCFVF